MLENMSEKSSEGLPFVPFVSVTFAASVQRHIHCPVQNVAPANIREVLKAALVAVGVYTAIRVDLAVLRVRVEHHEKEFARINKLLEK